MQKNCSIPVVRSLKHNCKGVHFLVKLWVSEAFFQKILRIFKINFCKIFQGGCCRRLHTCCCDKYVLEHYWRAASVPAFVTNYTRNKPKTLAYYQEQEQLTKWYSQLTKWQSNLPCAELLTHLFSQVQVVKRNIFCSAAKLGDEIKYWSIKNVFHNNKTKQ